MALYAIGDLHLNSVAGKPMDKFGENWIGHIDKIRERWIDTVKYDDTVVVTGDLSWGLRMEEVEPDLEYIASLPGRKILLRGNHDKFWKTNKTERLNEEYNGRLYFLQNNFFTYDDHALVGTKGFCRDDEYRDTDEQAEKLINREAERLCISFEKARAAGYDKFILFLHYPPTKPGQGRSVFTDIAEEYGAEQVVYSHLHSEAKYGNGFQGVKNGIKYSLVSSDYLDFKPKQIL